MERSQYKRQSPESVGIRSEALSAFLEEVKKENLELHTMLLMRKDKLLFEGFWAPYSEEKVHRICSAGKPLVAAAILIAIGEGLLSLDDKVIDLLSDIAEKVYDERAKRLTIYHLLTMQGGHRCDSYLEMHKKCQVNIDAFFQIPFEDEPGTYFFYDNGIPDVLAVILYCLTGKRVSEYLRDRLFDPLGIKDVRVEIEGNMDDLPTFCLNAWDFLSVTKLFYQNGNWNGKQIIRQDLAKKAVTFLVPTTSVEESLKPIEKEIIHKSGYGFQIWKNFFGGFILDGGCGQMGIGVPELELLLIMQSNEPMAERILMLFWGYLRGNMFGKPLKENPQALEKLRKQEQELTLAPDSRFHRINSFAASYQLECVFLGCSNLKFCFQDDVVCVGVRGHREEKEKEIWISEKWNCCQIPFLFPEMQTKSHRIFMQNIRLDTNVGYDNNKGYVAGVWLDETRYQMFFRSDAWMGYHVLTLQFVSSEGCMLEHECGISYNFRKRMESVDIGSWKESIFSERVYGVCIKQS